MSDAQVLGGNIDRNIHALRMLLYCYRCFDGRWQLLPPRSSFPLMLNLNLSAESRRLIVRDVQDWYNDPNSPLKHLEQPCARNYTAFTTEDAGQGAAAFGELLGYKHIMQPVLTYLGANGVFSAPKTGAGNMSGSQSKVALMTGKGEEAGLHHDKFKHEKMQANSYAKARLIVAIAETAEAVHPLELQQRMEWLDQDATHVQPVLVAPRYTATLFLNDLYTNEQYAHNGGQAHGDGARVLFAEDVSWEPGLTVEGVQQLLRAAFDSWEPWELGAWEPGLIDCGIAKELRDGPVTIVEQSVFRIV